MSALSFYNGYLSKSENRDVNFESQPNDIKELTAKEKFQGS